MNSETNLEYVLSSSKRTDDNSIFCHRKYREKSGLKFGNGKNVYERALE